MSTEELLVRGMSALDERIAKARAGGFKVVAKTDKRFEVTNGEGSVYEADFSGTNTGVCNCPDFASRGRYLHACKHTTAAVLDQWPTAFARWEVKVRALARTSIAQLPAEPEPELPAAADAQPPAGTPPAPQATAPPTADAQLVMAVVQATLPLVLAQVLAAVEEAAPEITRQVLAAMACAAWPSAAQEVAQQ
ncbi:MAG: hypothetical protein FJZ97_09425 [Chloroflexi bacterium]|nr:hypothetical protein [Chloroflexota bacterium]